LPTGGLGIAVRPDMRFQDTLSRRMADAQFYLAGSISGATVQPLLDAVGERVGKGARSILLALSSPGGNIYWGVTAYTYLRGLGIDIVTHNAGQVDSIAGVIYCAGERRLCVSEGRFLIHGVAAQFSGADPNIGEKDLQDRVNTLGKDRGSIAAILSARTGTKLDVIRQNMLDTTILNAEEGEKYGFVHEISDVIFDPSQEIVQIIAQS
jgi:ATP-dependent Clp protease protease subunit